MARWMLALELDRAKGSPLFLQIARAVAADIRRGRLRAGDPLPGTRTIAHSLGVQRQTVVAAFEELVAVGWIESRPARGAFVSADIPERLPRSLSGRASTATGGISKRAGVDLPPAPPHDLPYPVPPGGLLFAPNRPDVRLVPFDLIARAYRRAIRRGHGVLLGYGRPQGHARLRASVAAMLSTTRGIAAGPEDVCITRGSQMALALLARALLRPGDVVGVEALGHPPTSEAFRMQGATVAPLPLDAQGLRMEPLETLIRGGGLKAVYVTPHHQFPTTVTLSAARRMQLLELARRHRFLILEEDNDHEFHYEGRPVLPLASADSSGVVAYVGTFSKVLAPALRVGYLVAPRPILESVIAHRLHLDVQGDRVVEFALAELLDEGEIQRHVRRMRREYEKRRNVLVGALRSRLGHALAFDVPTGGIGLWARTAKGIDVDAWARRGRDRGVVVIPASRFAADGRRRPYLRLGFGALNAAEIEEGVRRLEASLR